MIASFAITGDPIGLAEVLRDYGVEEFGHELFVYLPLPQHADDQAAWAWVETARLAGVIRSGPWRLEATRNAERLRALCPKLFVNDPVFFQVFRLDRERLGALINRIGPEASG